MTLSHAPQGNMRAMLLDKPSAPLRLARIPIPVPGDHEVLIRMTACGVCRTDLHIADGELEPHKTPLVMGHEVVGVVVGTGARAKRFSIGDRIGVPWLGSSCGHCEFCGEQRENLCDKALFTGYDCDGGYADYAVADERYCFLLPRRYDDLHAAPTATRSLRLHVKSISGQRHKPFLSRRRTRPWRRCAPGSSTARPCWYQIRRANAHACVAGYRRSRLQAFPCTNARTLRRYRVRAAYR